MNILFIGDVVGSPGRRAVREIIPRLRETRHIDFIIANGENSAGGSGITPETAGELFKAGVHVITSGDHLWDQKEVAQLLADERRFLRPLNYPNGTPGRGGGIFHLEGLPTVGVVNLQGRVFMSPLENPFLMGRTECARLRRESSILFVDFHAEATSEKIAFARMMDGKASAVVGTHTHVQTADEQIFPGGTAFLCDAGFTGAHESVLGREIEPVLDRFLTAMPRRFKVARQNVKLQGALIEIDTDTGKATGIERISEGLADEASSEDD